MLLADHIILEWAGAIGGGLTLVGGAILGLYAILRKNKTSADLAESEATRKHRKEEMAIDSQALMLVVEDLRTDNKGLRDQLLLLQSATLQKIIDARDEHHECERKHAELVAKQAETDVKAREAHGRANEAEAKADALSKRVKELEERSK